MGVVEEEKYCREHPSYGLLQISRINGSFDKLFGSSIENNCAIELRVKRARVEEGTHAFVFEKFNEDIVHIQMTQSQFAEAITSLNNGSGTPCTIVEANGESIPYEEARRNDRERFTELFKDKCEEVARKATHGRDTVSAILEKKSLTMGDRASIGNFIATMVQEIIHNMPFMHASFNEAIEKTIGAARTEVESYARQMLHKDHGIPLTQAIEGE